MPAVSTESWPILRARRVLDTSCFWAPRRHLAKAIETPVYRLTRAAVFDRKLIEGRSIIKRLHQLRFLSRRPRLAGILRVSLVRRGRSAALPQLMDR